MNIVWTAVMIITLSVCLFFNPQDVVSIALSSCADALATSVNLCALYAWWLGIFSILEQGGAVKLFSGKVAGAVKKLFGNISQKAVESVCLFLSANVLGVSNAATPYGILSAENITVKGAEMTRPLAMLFILAATSLQILPTTVIGMRAQQGSTQGADIILPTVITTVLTALLGVLLTAVAYKKSPARA